MMSEDSTYDVAIIGGGPVGSTASWPVMPVHFLTRLKIDFFFVLVAIQERFPLVPRLHDSKGAQATPKR
jgi:hypothetical protein